MANLSPEEILKSLPTKYYVINKKTKEILQTNDENIEIGSTCHDVLFNNNIPGTSREGKCPCEKLTVCGDEIEFVTEQKGGKEKKFFKTKMVQVADETVIASLTDVTERMNTKRKLKINNQRLHNAEKLAKFGYWEYSLAENKMYASEGAQSIYGLSKQDFTLDQIRQCALPDYRGQLNLALYNLIENNTSYNVQFEIYRMSDNQIRRIHSIGEYNSDKEVVCGVIHDVTDRVKSEKALHESISDLNFTQHMAKIGNWKYDPAVKIPMWSKQVDQIFEGQLQPGMAVNESLHILFRDNFPDFQQTIDRAINQGIPFDYTIKLDFPSGEKWVEIICRPDDTSGPEGYAIRGSVQDISDSKKTENKLRQTNQLLRTLINNIPDAIYMKDVNLRKIIANKSDAINCGFKKVDEVLGKTDLEIYPESIAKIYMEDDRKVIENNRAIINREELLPEGDVPRWMLTSKIPLKDSDNKTIGLVGIGRDITDLKLHQLKLGLLQQTVEQIPLTVVITDTNGNIEYVNPGFTRSTGYTAEEALGQNPRILQSGHHPKSFYTNFWETILSGRNWYGEFKNKRKDGSLFWESVVVAPISNEAGEIKNFVAVKEDITEKKELIRELKIAKEQAEESDRLKTLFLANMSHEIRTPLNGILGFSSLVCSGNHDQDKLHYFGEIIENSGQRLLTVIDDIIDIAMIQSNQLKLNFETFSINHLLKELDYLYTNQYKNKLQKIAFDVEYVKSETSQWIYSDKNRVFQILKNLLENAFKFTQSGVIKLTCSEANNDQLTLMVEDTGIGIEESKLDIIFQSFRQAEESNSHKSEGTGLGLAIVSGIVEKLGGEIHVRSTFGKGTSFHITLPRNDQKVDIRLHPPVKNSSASASETAAKTIVSFEDDKVSADYLQSAVQLLGYKLVNFTSPFAGIEYLKSNRADLILMDVQLPEMSGYEATKIIKSNFPKLPVIIQTAYAMKGDRERAFEAGCDDYLAKPVSWDILKDTINKYLKQPN